MQVFSEAVIVAAGTSRVKHFQTGTADVDAITDESHVVERVIIAALLTAAVIFQAVVANGDHVTAIVIDGGSFVASLAANIANFVGVFAVIAVKSRVDFRAAFNAETIGANGK